MQPNLTTLLLKIPRGNETTAEAAQTFLAALTQINSIGFWDKLTGKKALGLALEIALINQQIKFLITCDDSLAPFIETQLQSNYPLVIMEKDDDPIQGQALEITSLTLRKGNYYPIQIYSAFTDIDPLSSILSVLAKSDPDEIALIQFALQATNGSWQGYGQKLTETGGGKKVSETGVVTYLPHPDANIIKEKISYPGFYVSLRVASNSKTTLREISSAFGVYTRSDGNSFTTKKAGIFGRTNEILSLHSRNVTDSQILNITELATLWHLPNIKIKTTSIVWGTKVLSEPPDNLPAATEATQESKLDINFFAKTLYKNHDVIFGIKTIDRRRHIWIVGKTGTGKSTLIENMAIDDLKKDRGVALIDPHGDACETLLDYVPKHRINDTIYFNPADRDFPVVINPLEVTNREEAELVVSGIVSIFNKIFGFSWGPRLEYILRNTLMTLASVPDATLEDVLTMLTNQNYRKRIIDQITDPVLKNFWVNEFNKMPDKLREESISPILNKVGQFVTSPLIRRIIGQPKSSIAIDQIMNEGKILICNLSQGRLGEDNATLLGAMIITKFQLAAMRRVDMPEDQRKDFYLYVDEFQNFATPSFMKILSEARKYRLCLTLANQYMAQIPEEVTKSILGNAGTMVTFTAGAEDADILHKEFAEVFSPSDLVNLARHQIAIKLMVDGHVSRPFIAHTLPLPASKNQNRDKVIDISRERWAAKALNIRLVPVEPIRMANTSPQTPSNNTMRQQKPHYEGYTHARHQAGQTGGAEQSRSNKPWQNRGRTPTGAERSRGRDTNPHNVHVSSKKVEDTEAKTLFEAPKTASPLDQPK